MTMLTDIPLIATTILVNVTHGLYYFRLKTRNPVRFLLLYVFIFLGWLPLVWLSQAVPFLMSVLVVAYVAYGMWIFRLTVTDDGYSRIFLGGALLLAFTQCIRLPLLLCFVHALHYPVGESLKLTTYFHPAVFAVATPFLLVHVRPRVMKVLDIAEGQRWFVVGLPPVLLIVMGGVANMVFTQAPNSYGVMALSALMPVCIVSYFASMYLFLTNHHDKLMLGQRLAAAERLEDTYRFYDGELAEKEGTLRRLRHDFRHLAVHLAELAREGDCDGILRELGVVSGNGDQTAITPFCENRTVNAVVSYHFAQAEKLGVNCVARAFVPEKLSLSNAELSMMLGNALENCVKASGPLGGGGYITFEAKPAKGCMLFVFTNNHRPGTYAKGKGVGLASIRHLCEQYDGRTEVRDENGEFKLAVFLQIL